MSLAGKGKFNRTFIGTFTAFGAKRHWQRVVFAAFLLLPLGNRTRAQTTEYQKKAEFLAQFPDFMEWPAGAGAANGPFLICVYGDFSFGTALAEHLRSATFHGRKLEARWVRKIEDLSSCQILFVSRSEFKRYAQVLLSVENLEVLTVGETPEFLRSGGAICFSYDGEILQFDVNLGALSDARLKISSRLLSMAKRVVGGREAAKGGA